MSSHEMAIRRYATLWAHEEGEWERSGPHSVRLWQRLNVTVSLTAAPYCCYLNTVIFYEDRSYRVELARTEHYDFNTASPILVHVGGWWHETSPGRVVVRHDRWHFEWEAFDHTRVARILNGGVAIEATHERGSVANA